MGGKQIVGVSYTVDGGITWIRIRGDQIQPGSMPWSVPNVSSTECKVMVKGFVDGEVAGCDMSDRSFAIGMAADVTERKGNVTEGSVSVLVSPSPVKDRMEISYSLPGTGYVRLGIFDCRGRVVTCLEEGLRSPGLYSTRWPVSDGPRGIVAPGLYFVRLETPGSTVTRKVVVVR
jgi:hypothetical protein